MMLAAKEFNIPLKLYWPYQKDICSAKAEDVFDLDRFPAGITLSDRAPTGWKTWKKCKTGSFQNSYEKYCRLKGSVQPYKENSKDFFEIIRSLPYKSSVLQEIKAAFRSKKVVGVHIRRGDKKNMEKKAPLKIYIEILKTMPESFSFFVCSDDKDAVGELKKEFGKRVLTFAKTFDRSSRGGGKDAVRDLLGLSRTSGIIGSTNSSFSRIAAEIGGLTWYKVGENEIINPST